MICARGGEVLVYRTNFNQKFKMKIKTGEGELACTER